VSDPTDIKALDEYLKGNSEVSQRYRELGGDEIPPELDRRVLAAARVAVANEGTKRSRSWPRWSTPVAFAASVVLVVTVVLERGVQEETMVPQQSSNEVRQSRSDAASGDRAPDAAQEAKVAEEFVRQPGIVAEPAAVPAPPAAPPAPTAEALAKAEAGRLAGTYSVAPPPEITVEAQSMRDRAEIREAPIAGQTLPVAAPTPASVEQIAARKSVERSEAEEADSADVSEVAVTGSRTRRAAVRTAGPRNTVSTRAFSRTQPASDEQREQSDPQAWLEDIRAMRRAGKTAEADREWQRFREAFPDFQVSDDDIARQKP
jgi:hypothetical protein